MTAIIPINAEYRIELDTLSWQVSRWMPRRSRPNGGSWEGITWHPSLQKAGESLVLRLVSETNLEGVDEVINAIADASRLIAAAIKDSPWPNSWRTANEAIAVSRC